MTPEQFCYWLHGFFELGGNEDGGGLTTQQVRTIEDHLDLVFTKVTPDRATPIPPPPVTPQDEDDSVKRFRRILQERGVCSGMGSTRIC